MLQRTEEIAVKMGKIINKMSKEIPERFLRLQVLLPACLAISSLNYCTAVKTVFGVPFYSMRHVKYFPEY